MQSQQIKTKTLQTKSKRRDHGGQIFEEIMMGKYLKKKKKKKRTNERTNLWWDRNLPQNSSFYVCKLGVKIRSRVQYMYEYTYGAGVLIFFFFCSVSQQIVTGDVYYRPDHPCSRFLPPPWSPRCRTGTTARSTWPSTSARPIPPSAGEQQNEKTHTHTSTPTQQQASASTQKSTSIYERP